MTEPYDDIINLPHPTSIRHPRMSIIDRAAQFSPFAALTGYDEAVREEARFTHRKAELSEDKKTELDMKLRIIAQHPNDPEAIITYFQADKKKAGGAYETATGVVKKIDEYTRIVIMTDGRKIPIDDIFEIEIKN